MSVSSSSLIHCDQLSVIVRSQPFLLHVFKEKLSTTELIYLQMDMSHTSAIFTSALALDLYWLCWIGFLMAM